MLMMKMEMSSLYIGHCMTHDASGESQHTHDTDKSVADVASHNHPAGSIMDHAHATDGRRGIEGSDAAHGAAMIGCANVHTHVSAGGKVDAKATIRIVGIRETMDTRPPDAEGDPAVAALPRRM